MPKGIKRDLTGRVFGYLTVLHRDGVTSSSAVLWRCWCECGTEVLVPAGSLCKVYGGNKTCGKCEFATLNRSQVRIKHGQAKAGKVSRLHHIWTSMNYRGRTRKDSRDLRCYQDVQVEFLPRRTDFIVFRDWSVANGYRDDLQIDRIDNSKGYSPDNCLCLLPLEKQSLRQCGKLTHDQEFQRR